MARIRTIKPEFPQSESMGNVSRDARLTFIQLWTIADDAGRLRGNSRMLASLLFPYDDDASGLIDVWLQELEDEGCITRYKVDGAHYIQINQWAEHQKIDKPSKSKLPEPPTLANPRESSRSVVVGEEGKGEEGKGKEYSSADAAASDVASDADDELLNGASPCPHRKIVDLYHEVLPMCPRVRDWTPARAAQLRARWNEDKSRQNLDYWRRFFEYVATCDFLVGKGQAKPGSAPFLADLEWMLKQSNFVKIRERKYEPRG